MNKGVHAVSNRIPDLQFVLSGLLFSSPVTYSSYPLFWEISTRNELFTGVSLRALHPDGGKY